MGRGQGYLSLHSPDLQNSSNLRSSMKYLKLLLYPQCVGQDKLRASMTVLIWSSRLNLDALLFHPASYHILETHGGTNAVNGHLIRPLAPVHLTVARLNQISGNHVKGRRASGSGSLTQSSNVESPRIDFTVAIHPERVSAASRPPLEENQDPHGGPVGGRKDAAAFCKGEPHAPGLYPHQHPKNCSLNSITRLKLIPRMNEGAGKMQRIVLMNACFNIGKCSSISPPVEKAPWLAGADKTKPILIRSDSSSSRDEAAPLSRETNFAEAMKAADHRTWNIALVLGGMYLLYRANPWTKPGGGGLNGSCLVSACTRCICAFKKVQGSPFFLSVCSLDAQVKGRRLSLETNRQSVCERERGERGGREGERGNRQERRERRGVQG
ncbi:hypothetical protein Q8A73_021998 [Channa argus]|nr:hypothetical protein Q8A73_021998 [Channa argus]